MSNRRRFLASLLSLAGMLPTLCVMAKPAQSKPRRVIKTVTTEEVYGRSGRLLSVNVSHVYRSVLA